MIAKERIAWNKGLTKETDKRMLKASQNMVDKSNHSGELNSRYKDGKTLEIVYCCDCHKKLGKLAYYNGQIRCMKCAGKLRQGKRIIPVVHKIDCNCCICKREEIKGDKHPCWRGGVTSLKMKIRGLQESEDWRIVVFQRDNCTCQKCNARNGNGKAVYLEAHHLKSFESIFQEFLNEYDQFSSIEDKEILLKLAIKYQSFWDVSNGQTLCKECHRKLPRKNDN